MYNIEGFALTLVLNKSQISYKEKLKTSSNLRKALIIV